MTRKLGNSKTFNTETLELECTQSPFTAILIYSFANKWKRCALTQPWNLAELEQVLVKNRLVVGPLKVYANLFAKSFLSPFHMQLCDFSEYTYLSRKVVKTIYNIAFVNSERWLAKSRVDITLCQHGKFPATLLLKFFVLYYKRNIKHFSVLIYSYINTRENWKNSKLCENIPPCGRRVSTQFLVFPISTRVDITVYQHGKCFIFPKYTVIGHTHNDVIMGMAY